MTNGPADMILSAPRIFTAGDAGLIEDGAVAVSDGVIAAVGRRSDVTAGFAGEEIRLPDATLLPGLVDSHEHLMGTGRFAEGTGTLHEPESMYALVFADAGVRMLRRGVTTVRVPGSYAAIDLVVRRAIAEGLARGPRLVCAGQPVTMTGGHGHGIGHEAWHCLDRNRNVVLRSGAERGSLRLRQAIADPPECFGLGFAGGYRCVLNQPSVNQGRQQPREQLWRLLGIGLVGSCLDFFTTALIVQGAFSFDAQQIPAMRAQLEERLGQLDEAERGNLAPGVDRG